MNLHSPQCDLRGPLRLSLSSYPILQQPQFHRFLLKVNDCRGRHEISPGHTILTEAILTATLHLFCKPSSPRARHRVGLTEEQPNIESASVSHAGW